MGIHESQSLLWERMVALSQPFAEYITAKVLPHCCTTMARLAHRARAGLLS